jgi:ribosomal protein S18 acetylase RimI-like enzyme
MNNIKSNIKNLTSLWQSVSEPFDSYFNEREFNYSLIKNSEWPNRLWFDQDVNEEKVLQAKNCLSKSSTNLIIPYWDMYNNGSFKILEQNGFKLQFEQIGMSLKREHLYTELNSLSFKKVSAVKDATLWSLLFSKSFGYFINPKLLSTYQEDTIYYIAYHKNEAVGTAILHTENNVIGVHSVGIIPEQRRKGYAAQIMKLLINESIKMESDIITLQSSDMGKGLYLKLGFKEDFVIKNYALQQ